jgi:GT2 family glycosyltransferase
VTLPRVDVVVVTWNTAELTSRALRTLLDSPQGGDLRVLVQDNASTDGTPARLAAEVPEADVVVGARNAGFAAAVNAAVARAAATDPAPWLLLLNSDAWPTAGAVGTLVAAAERRPHAAAVAPRLVRPDGTVEPSVWPLPSVHLAALTAVSPGRVRGPDTASDVGWAVGAALLIRRSAWLEVGPMDERLFMYGEDLDWCWRATERGWSIRFEPAAEVVHVGNASGARGYGGARALAVARNEQRVVAGHLGRRRAAAYRIASAAGAARAALVATARRDRDRAAYWRGVARAQLARPVDTDADLRPVDPSAS